MTSLADQLRAALAFDDSVYPYEPGDRATTGRLIGAQDEHARLAPLLEALVNCVTMADRYTEAMFEAAMAQDEDLDSAAISDDLAHAALVAMCAALDELKKAVGE